MLPPLRSDLKILTGPPDIDGQPTWLLYDPPRGRFIQIGWPVFEVLRRWSLQDAAEIMADLRRTTTLRLTEEGFVEIVKFLMSLELVRPMREADLQRLSSRCCTNQLIPWSRLLHNYLFFKVPLYSPDRFLTRALPIVRPFASRAFLIFTIMALGLGVVLVVRQWETFVTALTGILTGEQLVALGVAFVVSNTIHELAHGFVAKAHGCRVSSMGLAFLLLYPVPYTDTNETWRITQSRGRLQVGAAGMLAELALAVWATLLWTFLPDGPLRSAVLILAATSWLMSLAVNASPMMRFDGYYILSDLWGMPNLHARSAAFGRWYLREVLFGLGEPPPELVSPGRQASLIVFAYVVWIYRLIVFIAIALLVYHFFIKVIGIFLFFVEIIWFIGRPVAAELSLWWASRKRILRSRRLLRTGLIAAGILGVLLIPWHGRVDGVAIARSAQKVSLFAPVAASVAEISVANGMNVEPGDALIRLESEDLEYRISAASLRLRALKEELRMAEFEQGPVSKRQFLAEKLASTNAEHKGLLEQRGQLLVTAPIGGIVSNIFPGLREGQTIPARARLAIVRASKDLIVYGFFAEEDLARIAVGQLALFHPDGGARKVMAGSVTAIDRYASPAIEDAYLTTMSGGPIPVFQDRQTLVPQAALYRVTAVVHNARDLDVELRGNLQISVAPEGLLARVARSAIAVIVRESGF